MREIDYPPQEPAPAFAVAYYKECIARSFGVPFTELRYGDDPYQSIAIYPAERPNGAMLAFIHGGGWTGGYKERMGFMAPAFTARGILFASFGYRLAPQHIFPTGIEDVIKGLAILAAEAPRWGGDATKLVLGGHSAGGHYGALLAVRKDWQADLNLPINLIKGCLPISGVYLFGDGSGLSVRPRFLGSEENVEQDASPIRNIRDTPPPFLLAHGSNDFAHLMRQAEAMEAALAAAGGEVSRIVLSDCDHFRRVLASGDAEGQWVVEQPRGFLDGHVSTRR